jgi:hypothetical protein
MGYRKLSTSDIHDLIRRWRAREGVRQIARETGIDRKTVRRYIAAAKGFSIERDRETTEEEIARITARVQTRPARSPSEAWQQLMPFKEKIASCVDEQQRLRLRAARAMLASEGIEVTYWTLRRFAIRARLDQAHAATTRLSPPEHAQRPALVLHAEMSRPPAANAEPSEDALIDREPAA